MNPLDPTINRPGELNPRQQSVIQRGVHEHILGDTHPPFAPVKCDQCGTTHNLHGDCAEKSILPSKGEVIFLGSNPRTEQLPGEPKFNSLHISHLPLRVDGEIEHLFVAILNGEAVGQVLSLKQEWGACGLRMLYVAQKHRHMGIGSRLVSRVQVFAHNEKCNSIEICVHKGNQEGRKFWIRRKFIDMAEQRQTTKDYTCMERTI